MFHPLKIYQIKAEVLHWCRTPPSLLSQSNWAQWAGNLSLIPHCWISTYLSFISSEVLFIMPPPFPIVTWMVYCFPRRQLIFSFDRSGIYHLKGLLQYIPKLIPSVCPSICSTVPHFLTKSWTLFFKCLMLYINGFVSTSSTN